MQYDPYDDDDNRRIGPGFGGAAAPARRRRRRGPVVAAGLALAVIAGLVVTLVVVLNDKGTASPAASPTQLAAASEGPAGPASTSGPLAFGRTRELVDQTGTVRATAFAYRPLRSQFPPGRKGFAFAGVDVKVCVTKITDPSKKGTLSWAPWSLAFADSTTLDPVSSWSDDWFTVPLYPGFDKTVREGGCVRGWALFEVPKGKRPVRVVYAPQSEGGTGPLEWKVA